jgi:UDP-N-acetylmuramyl tripeptide synthase
MPALPTLASVWSAKLAALASRSLGRGGGTAVSGLVGLSLRPNLAGELASQLGHGCLIVTGTNGKTTTSRLISAIVRNAGLQPLPNASGSNLLRGIASTLTEAAGPTGALVDARRSLGVFEVDEATVPAALTQLRPRVAVFTNLFRDQLDRYGEVDAVASLWREALVNAPADLTLVLCTDDPTVASLGEGRDNVIYFGVDDPGLDQGHVEHAADAINCTCGARLHYDVAYFGHVGHWRCEACGRARPEPQVRATNIDLRDGRSLRFELSGIGEPQPVAMMIGGLYNVYNALAAAATAPALRRPTADDVAAALSGSAAAFGRQEAFEVDGRRVELFLGKNPAGLNQVFATLRLDPARKTALLLLNDNIADGRDISWVWDADFEVLAGQFQNAVVSGARAEELALRLKYAGWDESSLIVQPDIAGALDVALGLTAEGACLSVVPTYTAMLTVRDLLARRSGRAAFWEKESPVTSTRPGGGGA